MKKSIGFLAWTLVAVCLYGQSLAPEAVASAGGYFSNAQANAALSFTIGEMTMVETFTNQGYMLSQGFQQPTLGLVGLEDEEFVEEFVVYPNPASDVLNVRYSLRHPGTLDMRLYDMRGVEVIPAFETKYGGGLEEQHFALDQLAQGMYFLRVSYKSARLAAPHVSHHKINVINP